jgi:hypothetical protein
VPDSTCPTLSGWQLSPPCLCHGSAPVELSTQVSLTQLTQKLHSHIKLSVWRILAACKRPTMATGTRAALTCCPPANAPVIDHWWPYRPFPALAELHQIINPVLQRPHKCPKPQAGGSQSHQPGLLTIKLLTPRLMIQSCHLSTTLFHTHQCSHQQLTCYTCNID